MTTPFQLGNVCEDPERCDAIEEKGGDARESICPQCTVYNACQQRGFLSQPASLNRAKTQIMALPEIFFDPQYAEMAENLLKQMDDTERLCIIDRTQAFKLFPICEISNKILNEWSINWQGVALGNFAKALMHAVKINDIPHADAVKRIRSVVTAFEWQEKELIHQMCRVNVPGRIVKKGFIDEATGEQLARFSINFDAGTSAYIPLDDNASKKLTERKLPIHPLPSFALDENIKIVMSMQQAIQLGIYRVGTVKDIQRLPTISPDINWTYWHQLKFFFSHYTRDADAPIRWTGKKLMFWMPPVLHPYVKRLMLMSVNLSEQHLRRAFPDEKIEVRLSEPTTWVKGNKVFQIRTGFYPQKSILEYNDNLDFIGISKIGQRFFHGIYAEIEQDPNINHAIITYKSVAAQLSYLDRKENVSFVTHFQDLKGLNTAFEEANVVWIIGTPTLPQKVIWERSQILFGNDKEPLSYEEDTESEQYIDQRVQSVYEQSVTPKLARIVQNTKLDQLPNKKVVLLSSMALPQITDRKETILFDWEDFEVAGRLDKLPEVVTTREKFETERDNLTVETSREKVEYVLGCSSRQANRVLQKLRGGKPLRIPFREQIISLLTDGEKRTAELIEAIEGHPKAIKNELGRLVHTGDIVKVRWGVYTLP
ncbi:MAG: hypothetical protein OXD54_18755 [Candidatus Poribacteria bacterium]|nr:hypothetical protein [Candidatus Poribacteria bacterium]